MAKDKRLGQTTVIRIQTASCQLHRGYNEGSSVLAASSLTLDLTASGRRGIDVLLVHSYVCHAVEVSRDNVSAESSRRVGGMFKESPFEAASLLEQSDHRAPRDDLQLDQDFSDDRDSRYDQHKYDDGQTDLSREDDQDQTDDQFSDHDYQVVHEIVPYRYSCRCNHFDRIEIRGTGVGVRDPRVDSLEDVTDAGVINAIKEDTSEWIVGELLQHQRYHQMKRAYEMTHPVKETT
ncbi:hypothetical protein Sjap_026293 [Stephania japonica]|uniref:Uncharacterized protein n=1 Tax=Stephania japonica TaxID=461633 RepID=A0AAP0E6R1_9MAGN